MVLRTNFIVESSKVQGPGNRFTVWVQGCSIHCKGCRNTDTWDSKAGTETDIDTLVSRILKANVDGVTISGGEPLDQFEAVLELTQKVFPYLNVFLCSGYSYEHIVKNFRAIFDSVDLLCSGPFENDKVCESQWKGSSNQIVNYFTERGEKLLDLPVYRKEFRINKHTGATIITGFSS